MFDEARPSDHALMQDPAFAQALKLCGQQPLMLASGEVVLQRRFFGVRVAMLPRARPPPDLTSQLAKAGLHRTPLILSPETPCDLPRCLALRRPYDVAMLNLEQDEDSRRARLHPKWRNQLKAAEKRRILVTRWPLTADPNCNVLETESAQAKQRGYANWPAALTAAFAAAAPQQTHLFEAIHRGKNVAHMLFLTHGQTATYHIGHITEAGKRIGAHNLLLWQASLKLAEMRCRTLDLGLLHAATPDLNRFKLRCGATRRKTGGTHLYWHPFARS